MLNSKKSFLQKARIAMVAIVTIMSLGGAYAMNAPKHDALQTWGVIATVGNQYHVTAVTSGSFCDNPSAKACEVRSAATPDANNMIPTAGASVKLTGDFNK
ncbi:hypothetical protein DIU31_009415 [Mucilaginibacter rubeus]|uniref:Uncharacterized protein n=1 Tax=Mucilaginibacter rubeus TaxID=2027860 RepID=A0AAE6JDI2_9SPHI|nr:MULTISPECIES: hypothetical protein [Mucilaginibacter]QEM03719.1 hypothetical protein DIU31_009415 [Mucilaginibacter rubeus]QEM16330.1 hypothetical protein DIU38_009510 [Mucilaginibacter gossypii]QTE40905.1 hypothetical protein J3L19_18255 [Mucilaginibacter rubeus]QTE47508.1 hypothetical protein J3L21_18230 [Mucilaginibacter rubeus]QTE58900.1 hypothetical protein J3L23_09895 [Mucilaginibacter rubeus]